MIIPIAAAPTSLNKNTPIDVNIDVNLGETFRGSLILRGGSAEVSVFCGDSCVFSSLIFYLFFFLYILFPEYPSVLLIESNVCDDAKFPCCS